MEEAQTQMTKVTPTPKHNNQATAEMAIKEMEATIIAATMIVTEVIITREEKEEEIIEVMVAADRVVVIFSRPRMLRFLTM
jgi:hypothetical protein